MVDEAEYIENSLEEVVGEGEGDRVRIRVSGKVRRFTGWAEPAMAICGQIVGRAINSKTCPFARSTLEQIPDALSSGVHVRLGVTRVHTPPRGL